MILTHTAQREGKLLTFLRRELGMSTGLVKRLKYCHAYRVNGQPQYTNFMVRPGDVITVTLDEGEPEYPVEDGPLDILYEDEAVIALDKPAGLLIHPSSCRGTGTLANRLAGYYAATGQACLVHPVSRLDRDTFGVVLIAKNAHTHAVMQALLAEGAGQKVYHAAVLGGPAADSGRLDYPIYRPDPMRMLRAVGPEGQTALTDFQVLRRGAETSLLELRPVTGRTHQLRLHCLTAGFPILGDPQYSTEASRAYSDGLGLPWQQLCAHSLTFPHPITHETITVTSRQRVWSE